MVRVFGGILRIGLVSSVALGLGVSGGQRLVPTASAQTDGSVLTVATSADLRCGIVHRDDPMLSFWGTSGLDDAGISFVDPAKAACATLLIVATGTYSTDVFGPAKLPKRFASTPEFDRVTPFTPISQTAVTGTGTESDPFQTVTTVSAGTTGLTVTQTDTWMTSSETVETTIEVTESAGAGRNLAIVRVGECQEGTNVGFGVVRAGRAACIPAAYDGAARDILRLVRGEAIIEMSGTGATGMVDRHTESGFGSRLGGVVATDGAFRGACVGCTEVTPENLDLGISWTVQLAANSSTTVRTRTTVSSGASRATTRLVTMTTPSEPGLISIKLVAPGATTSVGGRHVRVLRDGTEVCSAVTDRAGKAKCSGAVPTGSTDPAAPTLAPSPTAEVIFDGDLDLRPSSKVVRLGKEPPDPGSLPEPTGCLVPDSRIPVAEFGAYAYAQMYISATEETCSSVRYAVIAGDGTLVGYLPGDGGAAIAAQMFGSAGDRLVATRFRQPNAVLRSTQIYMVAPGSPRRG